MSLVFRAWTLLLFATVSEGFHNYRCCKDLSRRDADYADQLQHLNVITGYYTKGSEMKGFISLQELCHHDDY